MVKTEKPYWKAIRNVLEQMVRFKDIVSWKEKYWRENHMIMIDIEFACNGRNIQFTADIDTTRYGKKTDWMQVLIECINQREKGERAELRMYDLMCQWQKDGLYGIQEVHRGSEYADKKLQADLVAVIHRQIPGMSNQYAFPLLLQIKSSEYRQKIHMEKHPHRASLVIHDELTDKDIGNRFYKLIRAAAIVSQLDWVMKSITKTDNEQYQDVLKILDYYAGKSHQ